MTSDELRALAERISDEADDDESAQFDERLAELFAAVADVPGIDFPALRGMVAHPLENRPWRETVSVLLDALEAVVVPVGRLAQATEALYERSQL